MVMLASILCLATQPKISFYGKWLNGTVTGYSKTVVGSATLNGVPCEKEVNHGVERALVLGTKIQAIEDTTRWFTADHHLIQESFHTVAGQVTTFGTVHVTPKAVLFDVTVAGKRSKTSVPRPGDGLLLSDYRLLPKSFLQKVGSQLKVWEMEDADSTIDPFTLTNDGPTTYKDGARTVNAIRITESSPQATVRLYLSSDGGLLREESAGGAFTQLADAKIVTLLPKDGAALPDYAELNCLRTTKPIEDAGNLSLLKLSITGEDLSTIPSDDTQDIKKDGDKWILEVHPVQPDEAQSLTIAEAGKSQSAWVKPSRYISSDDPKIKRLAARVVGGETNAAKAAVTIMKYVFTLMQPQYGVGEGRDAVDILKQQTGKCTDYSILTAALLRAAGIPAQIACGWLTGDGTIYYHAWDEAWDGKRWINLDSTVGSATFGANHVKLAEGSMENAERVTFPFNPSEVKIDVLDTEYQQ